MQLGAAPSLKIKSASGDLSTVEIQVARSNVMGTSDNALALELLSTYQVSKYLPRYICRPR